MKNLENYGVQEMSIKEQVEIDGGWTQTTHYTDANGVSHTVVRYYRWNAGRIEHYLTQVDGRFSYAES